jgi:hypothetical protein
MNDTICPEFQSSITELPALQKMTHEYAKFSRDAVGLGHVFGGALVLLLVFLLRHDSLRLWEGILLGATPYIWIVTKEWLRRNYYQFSGRVTQPVRRWHDLILGLLAGLFAALLVAILLAYKLTRLFHGGPVPLGPVHNTALCIAILLAMPFVAWRYLRAPYEFVTGVYLLALSAFLLSGNLRIATIFGVSLGYVAGIVALVMMVAGYAEHMRFLKLRRKMRALKDPA